MSTVLGVLLLLMTIELSGGRWFEAVRRNAEQVIGTLPALGILFLPIALGASSLYPWAARSTLTPELHRSIDARWPYLTPSFALLRAVVYWIVWIALGELVRRSSASRDASADPRSARRMRRLSAAGLIAVGLTTTFAAFDWLLSRTPDFNSSIIGVYWYAGATVAALALLGALDGLRTDAGARLDPDALHSLGNLEVAFILLWAYLAHAQFLIVWIADMPNEIGWFAVRSRGGWAVLGAVLVVGQFVVPFLLLLVRPIKRSPVAMMGIGLWLLSTHYLDMCWLVGRVESPRGIAFAWIDLATLLFVAASTAGAAIWRSRAAGDRASLQPSLTHPPEISAR